ncbi:MAG TPA: alcohol dehydrogenase catalytic domain-containing protein [Bacillota bacterium]|nr:alcohol dehydrogenase catalytic domain-containing protein [Bacillota bacterium]
MKAAFVTGLKETQVREIPMPEIKKDEVLLRVKTVGICGSDLHVFLGTHAFRKPPVILGHEVAGEVFKIGENVKKFKVGDRVTLNPSVMCYSCKQCKNGLINLCEHRRVPGTASWIGTFAEYFPAPESVVYPISSGITYPVATLTEPLAVAMHVLRQVKSTGRKSLAIIGCGTIGILTLFLARQQGYGDVLCCDPASYNREMAMKLGAKSAINPIEDDPVQAAYALTGGQGVDVCIIAAGAPGIVTQASAMTRMGGEIILVSMITEPIPVNTYSLVFREQTLRGAMLYTPEDFEKALEIINSGIPMDMFVTHQFPLENVQEAMEVLSEKKDNVIKIILHADKV